MRVRDERALHRAIIKVASGRGDYQTVNNVLNGSSARIDGLLPVDKKVRDWIYSLLFPERIPEDIQAVLNDLRRCIKEEEDKCQTPYMP